MTPLQNDWRLILRGLRQRARRAQEKGDFMKLGTIFDYMQQIRLSCLPQQ